LIDKNLAHRDDVIFFVKNQVVRFCPALSFVLVYNIPESANFNAMNDIITVNDLKLTAALT